MASFASVQHSPLPICFFSFKALTANCTMASPKPTTFGGNLGADVGVVATPGAAAVVVGVATLGAALVVVGVATPGAAVVGVGVATPGAALVVVATLGAA